MKTDDTVFGPIVLANLMPTGPSYLYLKHDQVVTGYPRLNPVVRVFGRSISRHTLITFSSVVATCDFFMVDAEGPIAGGFDQALLADLWIPINRASRRQVSDGVRGHRCGDMICFGIC